MDFEISELLGQKESESLDFKERFPDNTVDLIHDILCLANSQTQNNSYLIFGVSDNGEVVGTESDPNSKTQAHIYDCIRQSFFNHIPDISLTVHLIGENSVSVLTIKNRPQKPYFLTKDKTHGNKTIRAGVVYGRLGDTNIPLKDTASDSYIERMWRERFSIDITPLERLNIYLDEPSNWKRTGHLENFFFETHPEFQLISSSDEDKPFKEDFTEKFPDKKAFRLDIQAKYNTTTIGEYTLIACDGYRCHLPLPEPYLIGGKRKWRVSRNSNVYKISRLFPQYCDLDETLKRLEIVLFDVNNLT